MQEKSKKFSLWTIDEVLETFSLDINYKGLGLEHLLLHNEKVSEHEEAILKNLWDLLIEGVHHWNEYELEMLFISPLLNLVKFNEINVKSFIERSISAEVEGIAVHGEVDWIIAKGIGKPKAPYFCLKEFKKAKNSSNDPEGQLAIAMLAAQVLNKNEQPIYGAYVMGREWIFTMLNGKYFVESFPFQTSDFQQLKNVFCILKNLKNIIAAQINE
jgi:hypothetical protein